MTTKQREQLTEDFQNHINLSEIMDDMLVSVAEVLKPEDVFDEDVLENWATENGYEKPSE